MKQEIHNIIIGVSLLLIFQQSCSQTPQRMSSYLDDLEGFPTAEIFIHKTSQKINLVGIPTDEDAFRVFGRELPDIMDSETNDLYVLSNGEGLWTRKSYGLFGIWVADGKVLPLLKNHIGIHLPSLKEGLRWSENYKNEDVEAFLRTDVIGTIERYKTEYDEVYWLQDSTVMIVNKSFHPFTRKTLLHGTIYPSLEEARLDLPMPEPPAPYWSEKKGWVNNDSWVSIKFRYNEKDYENAAGTIECPVRAGKAILEETDSVCAYLYPGRIIQFKDKADYEAYFTPERIYAFHHQRENLGFSGFSSRIQFEAAKQSSPDGLVKVLGADRKKLDFTLNSLIYLDSLLNSTIVDPLTERTFAPPVLAYAGLVMAKELNGKLILEDDPKEPEHPVAKVELKNGDTVHFAPQILGEFLNHQWGQEISVYAAIRGTIVGLKMN